MSKATEPCWATHLYGLWRRAPTAAVQADLLKKRGQIRARVYARNVRAGGCMTTVHVVIQSRRMGEHTWVEKRYLRERCTVCGAGRRGDRRPGHRSRRVLGNPS